MLDTKYCTSDMEIRTKYNYFSQSPILLLKYVQGGDMFQLYRAIIRPYLKDRSISFFGTFGIPSVDIDGVVITYAMLFFTMSLKTRIPNVLKNDTDRFLR